MQRLMMEPAPSIIKTQKALHHIYLLVNWTSVLAGKGEVVRMRAWKQVLKREIQRQ